MVLTQADARRIASNVRIEAGRAQAPLTRIRNKALKRVTQDTFRSMNRELMAMAKAISRAATVLEKAL